MKSKIIKTEEDKVFEPFKIELTVETVQEARTLWHIFYYSHIQFKIKNNWYNDEPLADKFSKELHPLDSNTFTLLNQEIKSQGFKI